MSRRSALVVYVVQYRSSFGWWRWSAHTSRTAAWGAMRETRDRHCKLVKDRKKFRVRPYMPEGAK